MDDKRGRRVAAGRRRVPNTRDMTVQEAPARSEWLTVKMVGAEYPAVGERLARTLFNERAFPVYRVGGHRLVVRRSDLEAYIESGRVA